MLNLYWVLVYIQLSKSTKPPAATNKLKLFRIRGYWMDLIEFRIRLMTMSPLYPCGKPCSRGTHNETAKNAALSPAFDHDSIDRISIERLP